MPRTELRSGAGSRHVRRGEGANKKGPTMGNLNSNRIIK
jgi:hypothetical protein